MRLTITICLLFCLVVGLTGCHHAYKDCIIEAPEETLEQGRQLALTSQMFEDADWPENQEWWTRFNDPQLNAFVAQALANNPTIQIADVKVRIAEAKAGRARAPLYPSFSYDAASTRHEDSKTSLIPVTTTPGVPSFPFNYTLTRMTLDFTYEIDWWQKNRNTLKAALGEVQAAIADADQAKLMLTLSVAEYYFRIQTNFQRETLAKELVENRTKLRDLAKDRVQKGIDTDIGLQQAEIDLLSSKEFLENIQQDIVVSKSDLHALIAGDFQEEVKQIPLKIGQFGPFPLPHCLSIDLLAHRPDITAQLWRIQSATDKTKVAEALFYPDLDLRGLIGFETITINKLLHKDSQVAALGPALHLPIFQGGLLRANLQEKQEDYNLAIQEYNQLVLNAVKETLQGMNTLRMTTDRLHTLHEASQATDAIYKLTTLRFEKNLNSAIDVLRAQNNLLSIRDNEYVLYGYSLLAALSLIKATGGGYEQ